MHGQPRKPANPDDAAATAAKSAKLRSLQAQLLHNHHSTTYTKEAVALSAKLLEINPEVYTAWNYRKLALQHNLEEHSDPEAVKLAVEDELKVVEIALRRNPKSYGAWYHRKWLLRQKLAPIDFDHEFRLLDMLLKADARNFHGWNYRRFVARLKDVSEEEELKFTMDMINTNFSNYSAWHNRSMLLSNLLKRQTKGIELKQKILSEEFELVTQALFTDPNDQSGWFYHLWLLDQTSSSESPKVVSSFPYNGAKLTFRAEKENLLSSSNSISCYFLRKGVLPVILCFNEPVKGLSSSSVKVTSDLVLSKDVLWNPLSASNSRVSNCWVGYLKLLEGISNSQPYSVEISIPSSEDIVSLTGSQYNCLMRFTFTVELNNQGPKQDEDDHFHDPISWDCSEKFHFHDSSSCLLLDHLRIANDPVKEDSWHLKRISDEMALFKEMSEENSKFVKLTLSRLLLAYATMKSEGSLDQRKSYSEEILCLFDDLIKLDPSHKSYYEDQQSLVLMDKVTFNREALIKHYSLFDHHQNCLQFSKFSLARIGCVERLLWVQMLDLSHNKLRSIEGLEALQLLVCLNISNNEIRSFTALEPLKLLTSLRALDLSFNQIGAHSIDTTRYLCSSPLSHNVEISETIEDCHKEGINLGKYWEAILFLKPLQLAQLDIKGNAVAGESFRLILKKVLPSLKWFDGELVQ